MIARRQAEFCLAMGVTPREYRRLTRLERQAFWDVADDIKTRMKKKRGR